MGEVQYLVRAIPKSPRHQQALRDLGLHPGEQKFAIVKMWKAEDAQDGLKKVMADRGRPAWVRTVCDALCAQGVFDSPQEFDQLLSSVKQEALLLSVRKDHEDKHGVVHTQQVTAPSMRDYVGELETFAVPISSNNEEWYHKPAAGQTYWFVEPMVLIKRSRAKLVLNNCTPNMTKAINRFRNIQWYFVRNYAGSNADRRHRRL